ncbi:phospholipase D delta-like [Dorcoceras hygrometricum]|uniref:Phospholipase D delta-like n=1 Tax=Dorcoceras hygrometricum TaxID=472368 RepID=A0A2Z7CZN6_9LAMI|nr:phospholipase D delta-like [Dorcoceras hygrometricum]
MNWGRILFGFLKKMFPSSKILTDKTIHRYIAVIDKSGAQDPADAPKIKKAPKTKAASKKRPADIPLDVPVVKRKRTSKKKSTLKLVAVAQEAIPIQIVPAESAVEPMFEDQQTETEDAADRPAVEEETPADRPADEIVNVEQRLAFSTEERDVAKGDRVETWFDRALAEEFATAGGDSPTEKANDEIPWFVRLFLSADHDNERLFETGSDSAAAMDFEVHSQNLPVVKDTYVDPAGEQEIPVFEEQLVDSVNEEEMQDKTVQSAEAKIDKDEAMSLDDLILSIPADIPLPSASIEITKIKMGTKIQIPRVDEKLCYLASLPQITADDKSCGERSCEGSPSQRTLFFDLFKKLASINVEEMSKKEELVLSWGETESIHEALRRKRYILLKYREMLVRKFLESWKKNFKPGEGTSATDLQVIDMLWERHLDFLQGLSKKKITHGLLWDRPCCSAIFEGSPRDRGAVIARTNTNTPSRCWIRTMIYVDGAWTVEPCSDRWVKIPTLVPSNEVPPQRQYDDTLPPTSKFFRLMTKRWADICFEVVDFCASRRLLPVGSLQFCRSLSVVEPGYRVAPRQSSVFAFRVSQFCSVFVDFSVFSWLPTTDITDFLSVIALERTVLRNVQRSVSVVHPNVQSLDQHISSSTSSEDSSMNFDNTDIDATATAPAFSLPGSSTVSLDITKALNQLQASLDQISHRDDGAAFKDTILMHLRDIEKKFTARFDAQDRWIGALCNDSNDQRNLLSLEFKSSHRQLHTQIAASTIDHIDMQREVNELNAKVDAIALNLELVKRDAEVTKEAILHQLFEFQSQGEGVSSRGPQPSRAHVPIHVERRPLPTREPSPDAQSSGQYLSAEQAAEFVREHLSIFFREISRSIISADVFVKKRVSRQLQFSLVPSIGFCDREEPAGALLDDDQQVHYLMITSRCTIYGKPADSYSEINQQEFVSEMDRQEFDSSWGIRWKSADGMQSVVGLFSEIFSRYFPCELSAGTNQQKHSLEKSAEAFFSADVFVKKRVSRQLQFSLVPSIGFCDREEPAGALLDDDQQVHYLMMTSRCIT